METNLFYTLKGITLEEFLFIQDFMSKMTHDESQKFLLYYSSRRKNSEEYLLFILLGFAGVSGMHRLITGQIGLGILYFLTGGLFFIGTIIDAFNYRKLTTEYNRRVALEYQEIPGCRV